MNKKFPLYIFIKILFCFGITQGMNPALNSNLAEGLMLDQLIELAQQHGLPTEIILQIGRYISPSVLICLDRRVDAERYTPLMRTVQRGAIRTTWWLLRQGVNTLAINMYGQNVLDIAYQEMVSSVGIVAARFAFIRDMIQRVYDQQLQQQFRV